MNFSPFILKGMNGQVSELLVVPTLTDMLLTAARMLIYFTKDTLSLLPRSTFLWPPARSCLGFEEYLGFQVNYFSSSRPSF